MNIQDGKEIIIKAIEKRNENKAWELYLSKYQHMTTENYMSFEDFYSPERVEIERKTQGEILEEVQEILNSFEGV